MQTPARRFRDAADYFYDEDSKKQKTTRGDGDSEAFYASGVLPDGKLVIGGSFTLAALELETPLDARVQLLFLRGAPTRRAGSLSRSGSAAMRTSPCCAASRTRPCTGRVLPWSRRAPSRSIPECCPA